MAWRARRYLWLGFLVAVAVYGLIGLMIPAPVRVSVPVWTGIVAAAVFVGLSLLLPGVASGRDRSGAMDLPQWACDESVAVVGFVMRVLGRDWSELLAYLVVSALLLWLHRPRG
jgi:hypothetical protein